MKVCDRADITTSDSNADSRPRRRNIPIPFLKQTSTKPPKAGKKRVFCIDNVLSPSECAYFIQKTEEIGYQNVDIIFPDKYRDSARVLVFSAEIAGLLFGTWIQY